MKENKNRYLDLLNLTEDTAWNEVTMLASELSGKHHSVRSSIIDLHLWVEGELRRYIYFYLRGMLIYKTKSELEKKARLLLKNIDGMHFGQMWKMVEHAIVGSPWPDPENIKEINITRNQIAHRNLYKNAMYRGRSPFDNPDCFAQMYFDAWAISQSMPKLFHRTIESHIMTIQEQNAELEAYRSKFGRIDFSFRYKSPFEE